MITVSKPLEPQRFRGVFIVLSEAQLKELRPALEKSCVHLGICADTFIRQAFVLQETANAFDSTSEKLLKLKAEFEASCAADFTPLKRTAWERRNTNAPWYRRFQNRRRS